MRRRLAVPILLGLTASLGLVGCNLIFGIQDGRLDDGAGGGGAGASVTTSTSGGGQSSGGAGPGGAGQGGASGQGGAGGSPLCAGVSCDDSEPCTDDMCVDGECEHVPAAAPDLTALQTAGDCEVFECVGDPPEAQPVIDDGDVPPDDSDPCTDDICDAGALYPFSALFAPCQQGASQGECDGNGTCVPDECNPSLLVPGARIGADCGVFVAPGSSGTGARDNPTADLAMALGIVPTGKAVYVCVSPTFTGNFSLKPGTAIFGGLSCDWTSGSGEVPVLNGDTAGQPTLVVQGAGSAVIEGLRILGESAVAVAGGTPSVALLVDQSSVTIRNCVIESGIGGEGQPGSLVLNNPSPGNAGQNGLPQVCGNTADTRGLGGMSPCGNGGGPGGDGGVIGGSPMTGFQGQPGQGPGGGSGGTGEQSSSTACANGSPGVNGMTGTAGPGGTGDGSLSGGFMPAPPPGPGGQGTEGNGGGGGGGDGAFGLSCATNPGRAGGGGGGGGGGCRGAGGGGGRGGGASFAIVSLGANLTIEGSTLRASIAGRGGAGAPGELGSTGGSGGAGATGSQACSGGAGGSGGQGGPGGGGVGGPAALVARAGGMVNFIGTNALQLPMKAPGGIGATAGSVTGGTGAEGTVCDELVYVGAPFATCNDH